MPTQGFQLSQFERAPQVPGNIGVVDTKSIYGSVVDALKSFEAVRTAQAVQAATDAELNLATEKARTEAGLLSPEAEARRARAALLASESTAALGGVETAAGAKRAEDYLKTQRVGSELSLMPSEMLTKEAEQNRRRIEAEAVTSERLDAAARAKAAVDAYNAQRAELGMANLPAASQLEAATTRRGLAEAEVLSDPALIRRMAEAKSFTGQPAAVQTYVYAQRILNDPNSTPEQRRAAEIMIKTAPTATADPYLKGAQAYQAKRGTTVATLEAALPKIQSTLETYSAKTEQVERLIDQAAALVSGYSTGFGSLFERMPESDARKLSGLIQSIEANIGFDALTEMRANSPTGGALGNVSDFEGKRLSQTITDLDLGIDGAAFLDRLNDVRRFRRSSLERLNNALQRDQEILRGYQSEMTARPTAGLTPPPVAAPRFAPVMIEGYKVTPVP